MNAVCLYYLHALEETATTGFKSESLCFSFNSFFTSHHLFALFLLKQIKGVGFNPPFRAME